MAGCSVYKTESQIKFEDFIFPYGKLNPNNEWVKLAAIIPWDELEERYAKRFVKNGHPAHHVRVAIGCLIIKQILNCSDAWTVRHISENPYMQYFIGLKKFTEDCPFGESTMVAFRKRFGAKDIAMINELIIPKEPDKDAHNDQNNQDNHPDQDHQDSSGGNNSGTLILDATCTPADVAFPQDLNLLNESREHAEQIIDDLHKQIGGPKPRNYRKKARKDFLCVSKARKKPIKTIRRAIKKQLNYLYRDIYIIARMLQAGAMLTDKQRDMLNVITTVFEQQKIMLESHTKSIPQRIVSLSQPWIRPIVRGKAKAKTEFGAKLHISLTDGYARVERLDYEAFNETDDFIPAVEHYRARAGKYPARVLADKLYRNRNNLDYCKEHHIAISGPRLGRPPKDAADDKKQEYADLCERNTIEGEFGTGKHSYGWDRIAARLKNTSETVICLAILVMNLRKRLRAFLRLFFDWAFHTALFPCHCLDSF